jgi:hypothetical protein
MEQGKNGMLCKYAFSTYCNISQICLKHASERQIKGWSRKKKEGLIKGDWKALSIYAKRSTDFD